MGDGPFEVLRSALNRRLPFLGLAATAMGGIIFADRIAPPSLFSASAFLLCCAGCMRWKTGATLLAAFFAFATVHAWRTTESPGLRFASLAKGGPHRIMAIGRIIDDPMPAKSGRRFLFSPDALSLPDQNISIGKHTPGLVFLVFANQSTVQYGDRVEVEGILQKPRPTRNPGGFDYPDWLKRRDVWLQINASRLVIVGSNQGNPVIALGIRLESFFSRLLAMGIADSREVAALIRGMTLGSYAGAETIQKSFRDTGTYHLFSVSGLHVAMVGLIVSLVCHPFGRRVSIVLTLLAIVLYTLTTGLRPAGVRAALMGSLVFAGMGIERRPQIINSLACALVALLCTNTNLLFDIGFQLSFLVVGGIVLGARPLEKSLNGLFHPDPFLPRPLWNRRQRWTVGIVRRFASMSGVSIAAWVASVPLIASSFHVISWIGPAANLFAVPLAFAILALALASILGGSLCTAIADIFNQTNWLFASFLIWGVQGLASLPGGHAIIGKSCPRQMAELTVLDLGRGAATLLRTREFSLLIDCGNSSAAQFVVTPFLWSCGLSKLDALVLTHGDSAHMGGWREIVDEFKPARLMDAALEMRSPIARSMAQSAGSGDFSRLRLAAGDFLPIKKASPSICVEVLHPRKTFPATLADDKALVLLLHLYGSRVLLLSDSGPPTIAELSVAHPDLRADLIVLGRHSAGMPPPPGFLARLGARAVVATVDEYPRTEILDLTWAEELFQRGIALFRQDQTGAVVCQFENGGFRMRAFLGNMAYESLSK